TPARGRTGIGGKGEIRRGRQAIRETYATRAQAERRSRRRPRSAGERPEPTGRRRACQIPRGRAVQLFVWTATRKNPLASVTACARSCGGGAPAALQAEPLQRGA